MGRLRYWLSVQLNRLADWVEPEDSWWYRTVDASRCDDPSHGHPPGVWMHDVIGVGEEPVDGTV